MESPKCKPTPPWRWRFEHGRVPDQLGQTAVSLAIAIRRLVELFESIEPTIENTLENRSGLERETAEQWLAVVSATSDRLRAAAARRTGASANRLMPPRRQGTKKEGQGPPLSRSPQHIHRERYPQADR